MTNKEYKERRQTLGLAIAALDKEHLEDREFADGELVEIDYAWHKRIGVVCGCLSTLSMVPSNTGIIRCERMASLLKTHVIPTTAVKLREHDISYIMHRSSLQSRSANRYRAIIKYGRKLPPS